MFYLNKKEFDYAIRICAYLAGMKNGSPISVNIISKKLLISKPFATKIIFNLRSHKIIGSKQGKFGGVFLTVNPQKLTLFDILKSVGFNQTISGCINEAGFCPLPSPCKLHSYFIKTENKLLSDLKSKKISSFSFTDSDLNIKK